MNPKSVSIHKMREAEQTEAPRPLMRDLGQPAGFPIDNLGDTLSAAAAAIHEKTRAPLPTCGQSVLAVGCLAAQGNIDVELPTGGVRPVSEYFVTISESDGTVFVQVILE